MNSNSPRQASIRWFAVAVVAFLIAAVYVLLAISTKARGWRRGNPSGSANSAADRRSPQHTACRHGGSRLGLILPASDEQTAESIAGEVLVELRDGPVLRVAAMAWRPGEDGEAVIARARLATG